MLYALPHDGFHRRVGGFAGCRISPDGRILTDAEWGPQVDGWLPREVDKSETIYVVCV